MKKHIMYILFVVISSIFASDMLIHDNTLLFCIDKNEPMLDLSNNQLNRSENQIQLNNLFE